MPFRDQENAVLPGYKKLIQDRYRRHYGLRRSYQPFDFRIASAAVSGRVRSNHLQANNPADLLQR